MSNQPKRQRCQPKVLCFTDVCKEVMDETGIDLSGLLSEDLV